MANSGKLWKRDCEGEVQGLAMARDRTDIFEEGLMGGTRGHKLAQR